MAIAALVASAVYLLTDRNLVRVLLGIVLLGNGVNLALFLAGDLVRGAPALIPEGAEAPTGMGANALPQALVLTAIVIGFGLFSFALSLIYRTFRQTGSINSDDLATAGDGDAASANGSNVVRPESAERKEAA
ncbi:MAG: NADH-quinone oxidoreductase subunit K [Azospirillaceae bacterium]